MPQSLGSAIGKLKRLRAALSEPTEFFASQLETQRVSMSDYAAAIQADAGKWIGIARQTARDVVFHSPPAAADSGVDLDEWGLIADYIASKVGMILAPGGNGVVLFLGESQAEFSFAEMFGQSGHIDASAMTLEQITDYVEAGLRDDPLGKEDITEHDVERTAQQTAFNILLAFRKRNFSGEREEKIVEFVMQRSLNAASERFPAILEAWKAVFSVVGPRDFAKWCEMTAKKILE